MSNIFKEIDTKNGVYHFFNDMINIKNLDPNTIKINKKSCRNILIYYIGHVTITNLPT